MPDRYLMAMTTTDVRSDAERLAHDLVERRLAACVNILPSMVSLYRWEGTVERGEEAVMIVKTRASLASAVETAVKAMHSYTTPAILVMPIEAVEQSYFRWILAETGPA